MNETHLKRNIIYMIATKCIFERKIKIGLLILYTNLTTKLPDFMFMRLEKGAFGIARCLRAVSNEVR